MKTIKIFRVLAMAAGLACFMISCLPADGAGYDWTMIAILALFLVIVPTGLIGNIKRENHPQTLTEYKKGYFIITIVLAAIVTGLCITGLVAGFGSPWMNLAFLFCTVYTLLNHIILYKAKKAYDSEK